MRRPALLQLASASLVLANVPRGVSPEDATLYVPSSENTFSCLTHPSISIPFSRVNDDFCDCPDGSDEPGTSACATLSPHNLSIRGFYCANKHHTAAFLPLSRVNDGICDYDFCCDGSDEYLGVGGIKCENRCKEIGNAARKLASERQRVRSAGGKLRDELVRKASVLRKEIEDNIETTKAKIEGQEVKVQALEEELKETEARERAKVVRNPKPGSKVSVVAEVAREKLDEYRHSLTKLKAERDAAEAKLEKTESILRTFKDEYNPNFNDEGVKRAVRGWEEYLAENEGEEKNAAEERDLENLLTDDGIDWDELIGDGGELDDEVAILYSFEEYLPESVRSWVQAKLGEFRQMLVDNGILAARKDSDAPESQAVSGAREALKTAQKDLDDTRKSITSLEEDLSKDYGDQDVFRSLKDDCVSRDFGEYRYEFCYWGKSYQHSLKDSSKVSLGDFSRIEYKDETSTNEAAGIFQTGWEEAHEEPLSGVVLKYENGQQCWNGPKRSANVELYCSAETEIRSVQEAEKCVYRFEVGAPTICQPPFEKGAKVKDEL